MKTIKLGEENIGANLDLMLDKSFVNIMPTAQTKEKRNWTL